MGGGGLDIGLPPPGLAQQPVSFSGQGTSGPEGPSKAGSTSSTFATNISASTTTTTSVKGLGPMPVPRPASPLDELLGGSTYVDFLIGTGAFNPTDGSGTDQSSTSSTNPPGSSKPQARAARTGVRNTGSSSSTPTATGNTGTTAKPPRRIDGSPAPNYNTFVSPGNSNTGGSAGSVSSSSSGSVAAKGSGPNIDGSSTPTYLEQTAGVAPNTGLAGFGANAMIAFTVAMYLMQRTDQHIQAMSALLAVRSMVENIALGRSMSKSDLAAGKAQAQIYTMQGIGQIFQAAASFAAAGMSLGMAGINASRATSMTNKELGERPPEPTAEEEKTPTPNTNEAGQAATSPAGLSTVKVADPHAAERQAWDAKYNQHVNNLFQQNQFLPDAIKGFGSLGQGITSFGMASAEIGLSQQQAAKDMLQAYSTANSKILDQAFDTIKNESSNVTQVMQALNQLFDEFFKSFAIKPL